MSKEHIAYKMLLLPNRAQQQAIKENFDGVRFYHNVALTDCFIAHKLTRSYPLVQTPASYKSQFSWLKQVDSLALCNRQLALNKALKNHQRNPAHFGLPRFKCKKASVSSYTTNNQGNNIRLEKGDDGNTYLTLPKIGPVLIKQHRPIIKNGEIKSATVRWLKTGEYKVTLLVDYDNQVTMVKPTKYLGLDFSMTELFLDSEGRTATELAEKAGINVKNIKIYAASADKLARLQEQLSRKTKGSKSYKDLQRKITKLHAKIANQRDDFQHKLTTYLANNYELIGVETLNLRAMAKHKDGGHFCFGKSVHDLAWCNFLQKLSYKMHLRGRHLFKVDRYYPSSQLCSKCGYHNKEVKNLSVREWECPKCGAKHNRDHNAAINIRNEAKRLYELQAQ